MKVNIKKVISFFDERPQDAEHHASGLVGIAGEDLGTGVFKHYIENVKKANVNVLTYSVTTGHKKGPRLDRWIDVLWVGEKGTIFQTEIKNWSAHSYGGTQLFLNASKEEVKIYKIKKWNELWDSKKNSPNTEKVSKVLVPMRIPSEVDRSHTLEPLVIYWTPIHPEGKEEHFFCHKVSSERFSRIWFFSVSSYLRSLDEDTIELDMPSFTKRVSWISKLFKIN